MADSLAQTLSFSEPSNSFESFLSYHPEMMGFLGNILLTYKDGDIYTHDNTDNYNKFYEVDYPSWVKVVFNQNPTIKKSFVALTEAASSVWTCPEIITQVKSYGSTAQQSNLVASDFDDEEGQYNAALLGDLNSPGNDIVNGEDLKGKYIIVKFYIGNATILRVLSYAELKYIDSPYNAK